MEKRFSDLKVGDTVWILDRDKGVIEESVKGITNISSSGQILVYIPFYGSFTGYPGTKMSGRLFINIVDLERQLRKRIGELEGKIDHLVSEFQRLESLQLPPTVISSTNRTSMGGLKPGDSVWEVRMGEFEVRRVEVRKVEKKMGWSYGSLVVHLPTTSFSTFPEASCSVCRRYYTEEDQAWRYMLGWKKLRMGTVGKQMERLMCRVERYEDFWRSEGRR